mmetsp:Transcript_42226/g.117587  ORF Transcript_42226/g.117587 Transcript_42226/m.117587 type:complete len:295 (+) Transcript_42226:791-1675(+)
MSAPSESGDPCVIRSTTPHTDWSHPHPQGKKLRLLPATPVQGKHAPLHNKLRQCPASHLPSMAATSGNGLLHLRDGNPPGRALCCRSGEGGPCQERQHGARATPWQTRQATRKLVPSFARGRPSASSPQRDFRGCSRSCQRCLAQVPRLGTARALSLPPSCPPQGVASPAARRSDSGPPTPLPKHQARPDCQAPHSPWRLSRPRPLAPLEWPFGPSERPTQCGPGWAPPGGLQGATPTSPPPRSAASFDGWVARRCHPSRSAALPVPKMRRQCRAQQPHAKEPPGQSGWLSTQS